MVILKAVPDISALLHKRKVEGRIGYVPTMGALHNGHLSLIERSKGENGTTVCSIFVNPTQFNDKIDFEKYPVKLEDDIALLINAGCDILFLPTVAEIYLDGTDLKKYDLASLETLWEGKYRAGHFQGVCQVMDRLLGIIQPNKLYLGQKDYQQCMVIQKLIHLSGFNTILTICSTVREKSGLAMSSRNMRLSEKNKDAAITIFESLTYIKKNINNTSIELMKDTVTKNLLYNGFTSIDYVAVCNADTLENIIAFNPSTPTVALIAAFIDGVRLIDNMLIS